MGRLSYSWIILAAGFVILFFSSGSRFAFGLMLKPMSEDLGWSRSTLTLAITAFMLVSALSLPMVGRLADRYSLRLIMGIGAVLGALGIALMAVVNAPWQLFLVYGLVYAMGNAANSNPAVGVMVTRWFVRRRAIATSAAVAGGAVGQLVIITLLSALLLSLGWRTAFAALGAATLAVLVPVVLVAVRPAPQETNSNPSDGGGVPAPLPARMVHAKEPPAPGPVVEAAASGPGMSLKAILGSRQLALLFAVYAICGFQDFFVATHLVAFAQDQGVGTVLAGNMLAFMGLMGLAGVLGSGVLADSLGAARPTAICFLMRVGIFAHIIFFQDTVAVGVFALLYGFTFLVTAPLTVVFAGTIFGQRRLGLVAGSISMVHQVFGGLGALAGGVIFDQWGSYDRAFVLLLALSLIAIPLTLLVREKPLAQARPSPSAG